ncbi:helix-turn-helix transcriptional regulator [Amycolatopsis dongchuanensis]|uniref:Helix-turn-helix transcriptional regulator n=2 Tax=Amycolatopsis dongchuanensis TaxID=1070866 RepID=A0ABP9QYJ0_9PSEU
MTSHRKRFPQAIEFGHRVRARRHELGWSIETLADNSGLHWTYVGSVERGERNVALLNIVRLAAALQMDAAELVRGIIP